MAELLLPYLRNNSAVTATEFSSGERQRVFKYDIKNNFNNLLFIPNCFECVKMLTAGAGFEEHADLGRAF